MEKMKMLSSYRTHYSYAHRASQTVVNRVAGRSATRDAASRCVPNKAYSAITRTSGVRRRLQPAGSGLAPRILRGLRSRGVGGVLGGAAVGVLFGLLAAGCSESSGQSSVAWEIPDTRTVAYVTSAGTHVTMPAAYADHWQDKVDLFLRLVDEERTEKPIHGTTHYAGAPPGYRVVILQDGAFPYSASPTGFAVGVADVYHRTIYVAARAQHTADDDYLPALGHEYSHAWGYVQGDLNWGCLGHGGCGQ